MKHLFEIKGKWRVIFIIDDHQLTWLTFINEDTKIDYLERCGSANEDQ
jgi:hypothetical protein